MQICTKEETSVFMEGNTSIYEYDKIKDSDINGAIAIINGRYPESGLVSNLCCKEMVYIVSGTGRIIINDKEYELKPGTTILIDKNEKYFWVGTEMKIFMPCTPAWYSEQHVNLDD